MNVYDFDKTIYNGDSTRDFYLYSLIKHPEMLTYKGTYPHFGAKTAIKLKHGICFRNGRTT